MKAFLEEYGLIIIVVAVIMVMLLLGTTVGGDAKDNIVATVKNFLTTAEQVYPDLENPGGGSGETSGELNEYGFYFDREYYGSEPNVQSNTCIFHEDGSAELKHLTLNDAGYLDYPDNDFTFSSDGTEVVWDGYTFKLNNSPSSSLNAYDFYFQEKYEGNVGGGYSYIIFYEDGSFTEYYELSYPTGTFTYEQNKVLINGEAATFSADGKQLTFPNDSIVYTLVE